MQEMLTGVVTGPGIPPTPGEHLWDTGGRWIGQDVLPVLADRSDPARFVIWWDELPTPDWRADARGEAARAAERMRAAAPAAQGAGTVPDGAPGPDWVARCSPASAVKSPLARRWVSRSQSPRKPRSSTSPQATYPPPTPSGSRRAASPPPPCSPA